ncbi:cytochrome P450, partial [Helicosporidium sp. ATCC 50920]
MDRILSALEARGETWGPATERQLVFEIKTFLLAGHETSAAMLSWTLYELSVRPDLRARVREEARAHLPQHWGRVREEAAAEDKAATEVAVDSPEPAREQVERMEYSLSCLKESLRKYSVVPVVTRNLDAPDSLCGYDLPKGSWIVCHIQRVHHLYQNPLNWDPLRFMPGGEYDQFDEDIRPYMFLPFTAGPRNCLGQHFALLEARVLLGQLCERFDFKPVDAEKQGRTDPHVVPVGPVNGMPFYI